MLKEEAVEKYSGINLRLSGSVPILKTSNYKELKFYPGGDAPKSFIAYYEYEEEGRVHKNNIDTWPRYIAKVGHKWYPIESINEYLFNQIGEALGLRMAHSKLVMAGRQLRFLSRYFLKYSNRALVESLVHGAEIFSSYISDKELVQEIEQKQLARRFFTFGFTLAAIMAKYPDDWEQITEDLVKMIVFDAVTGNNDRHFYNWGVVEHINNKYRPVFSPIYDSARGLFWNNSESSIEEWYKHPKLLDEKIKKYAEGSKPKIGWEGLDDLNHFELVHRIISYDKRYKEVCSSIINEANCNKVLLLVQSKFGCFYSKNRMELIQKCLKYRFDRITEIINN